MLFHNFSRLIFSKVNRIYLSLFLIQLLFWINGCTISWTSPTIPKLLNVTTSPIGRAFSVEEVSWISSLVTLGGLIGPFLFGYTAKKLGKRKTLLLIGMPYILSYLILAFARVVELFYIARFITGLAMGGSFTSGINYVMELTNKNNRGAIGSTTSVTTAAGMLFSYCLGPYLSIMVFNLLLALISLIFLITFLLVASECPIYHLRRQNEDKARDVIDMKGSVTKDDIDLELQQIKSDLNLEDESIFQLFKSPSLLKLFFICLGLFIVQQLCGGVFIQYYSQTIFEKTGAPLPPEICAMIVGVMAFISSLITPFIFDRYGRKKILVTSCLGMCITHIPMAVYMHFTEQGADTSSYSFLPILTMSLNILAYNIGAGPLPFIIPAELFPQRVKISATSLIGGFNWIFSFGMTNSFGFFIYQLGLCITFSFFGICCFIFAFYCHFIVPETNGKSLEELHIELAGK